MWRSCATSNRSCTPMHIIWPLRSSRSERRCVALQMRATISRASSESRDDAPSMLRTHLRHQGVGYLEIRIDVLHVVMLVKHFHQLEQLFALLVVDRDGAVRLPHQSGLARLAELSFQGLGNVRERFLSGIDLMTGLVRHHIFGA